MEFFVFGTGWYRHMKLDATDRSTPTFSTGPNDTNGTNGTNGTIWPQKSRFSHPLDGPIGREKPTSLGHKY